MFFKKKNRDATRENRKREDKKRSSKRIRHTENDIERENRKKKMKKKKYQQCGTHTESCLVQ